jgi:hypothetical protein
LNELKNKFRKILDNGGESQAYFGGSSQSIREICSPKYFDTGSGEIDSETTEMDTKQTASDKKLPKLVSITVDWMDQYVLGMDVTAMRDAFNKRAEEEVAKKVRGAFEIEI